MMTANSKLIKEIRNIIASTTKARTITQQEIDKVDAKYAALAEKEKKDLNKLLEIQNAQIAAYSKMIEEDSAVSETPEEKTEEAIRDTIFPENNETETEEVEGVSEVEKPENETVTEAEELPEPPETVEVKDETSSEELDWGDDGDGDEKDDEWPEVPEEW